MAASTILLLESVASAGDTISSILTGAGYGVTMTADPEVALDQGASHQLVMFDVTSGPRSGIDICREFRALPAAVGVPVMGVTTPTRSRSGSPISKPVPTTSWPGRSTHASSRRESRPCFCGSSGRATSRRSSHPTG